MTRNQIDYQNLLLTKQRDQVNAAIGYGNLNESVRHNKAAESETERHNRVVEDQSFKQLVINEGMLNVNQRNADTNRLNYYVNKQNADTNARNAETNRMNYYVNVQNATSNRISANAAALGAQASMLNAQVNQQMIPIAETNAVTNRMQANNASRQADAAMIRAQNDTSRYYVERERAQHQNDLDASRTRVNELQYTLMPGETEAKIKSMNAEANYKQVATLLAPGKDTREWIDSIFQGGAELGRIGMAATN